MKKLNDGWFLVRLHQARKEKPEHPDYFSDWIELVDGEWQLGEYEKRCDFSEVIISESDFDKRRNR